MASFRKRGKIWYFTYTDENGDRKEEKGDQDQYECHKLAREKEDFADRVRRGRLDPREARLIEQGKKPLLDHVSDWRAFLLAKGTGQKQADMAHNRVQRIIELSGIEAIAELRLSVVQGAIKEIHKTGVGLRTLHHYTRNARAFSRWLRSDGRARDHALEELQAKDPKSDKRHERRALEPDELTKLIAAAESGPRVCFLSGPDRAMLYRLAIATGFRAKELRPLTPERFNLDSDPPTVTCRADYAKNGEEAVQPIPRSLARRLKPWLATKPAGEPVFRLTRNTAELLKSDLTAAGLPYRDRNGRVADFHSLRNAYISQVVASGASVKTAQTLARHSTPSLTIGIYAKASLHDINGAVESLPDLDTEGSSPEAMRATGTDGRISDGFAVFLPCARADSGGSASVSDGSMHGTGDSNGSTPKGRASLKNKASDESRGLVMASDGPEAEVLKSSGESGGSQISRPSRSTTLAPLLNIQDPTSSRISSAT
jgi:integrase